MSDGTVRFLRLSASIAGLIFIAASVLADSLGLSAEGGLSRNQLVILILGCVFLTAGILGRRFAGVYRYSGLLLINLLLFLLLLDIISLAAMKLFMPSRISLHARKITESELLSPGDQPGGARYAPYVVWKALPGLTGESTDSLGHRITPGSTVLNGSEGIRIFLLGGSASWGTGVGDRETVAAHLASQLRDSLGQDIELLNLSQVGWNSTQEMIELIMELRSGNVPDIVVFMDGFNDVFTAYQSGQAGMHQNYLQTAQLMENRIRFPGLLDRIWHTTNISILADMILRTGVFAESGSAQLVTCETLGADLENLSEEVVSLCLANYSVIRTLGSSYGFRCMFIWQPVIWLGGKPLSPEEERISSGTAGYEFTGDPAFRSLLELTYEAYSDSMAAHSDMYLITDVFDSTSFRVYTDPSGVHVDGTGNSIIASRICGIVLNSLESAP